MSAATDELTRRYRAVQANLRVQVATRLNQLYAETIQPDDLDAAFVSFTPRAAAVVQAGQSAGVSLATAYLAALVTISAARTTNLGSFTAAAIVGTTAAGASLAEGMAAFPAMVKGQIGKGVEVAKAVEYGRFLAERFSDAEVTAAVDRHTDAVTKGSGEFSGWAGILTGRETCDPCRANEGFHALDASFYRHPGCDCTREYLVAI